MLYSVVGADGNEYGPVDEKGLAQWVREGRVIASTVVIDRTTGHRCRALDLPHIAAVLAPPVPSVHASYPVSYDTATYGVRVGPDGRPLKSKLAAGLLGIFTGSLGIHRFYLGYTTIGVVMLLLTVCTCGYGGIITGVWGMVEGILCLTGSLTDAEGRPLGD